MRPRAIPSRRWRSPRQGPPPPPQAYSRDRCGGSPPAPSGASSVSFIPPQHKEAADCSAAPRNRARALRYLSSSPLENGEPDELWPPQDGAGLGVAQLAGSGAGVGAETGAAGLGAAFFFATRFLAPAFLADFFGDAAFDFLADFFAAFLADFLADFLAFFADFLAVFFEDFFADFFFAVRSFFLFFLFFLPFLLFLPLAIVILLLPLIQVFAKLKSFEVQVFFEVEAYRELKPIETIQIRRARSQSISSFLAADRLSPNREAQSCAQQGLTYRRQSAPCIQYCPRQSCPA